MVVCPVRSLGVVNEEVLHWQLDLLWHLELASLLPKALRHLASYDYR